MADLADVADVADLFFLSTVYEEEEEYDDDVHENLDYESSFWPSVLGDHGFEEEDDDEHDFHTYHHHYGGHLSGEDRDVDEFPPVFSHDLFVSDPPVGGSVFYEDDSESRFLEERETAPAVSDGDLDDRSGGTDDENLDPSLYEGAADYFEEGLGLGLGLGFDFEFDADEQNYGVGGFGDVEDYCGVEERYESEIESEGGSETEVQVQGESTDFAHGSDWGGAGMGSSSTYLVEPMTIEYDREEEEEEFEWEDVVEESRISPVVDPVEAAEYVGTDIESEEQEGFSDVGWNLFILLRNIDRDLENNPYGEYGGNVFIHPSEYEGLFERFAEQDSVIHGSPPAAKLVVEKLPTVFAADDDPTKSDSVCAICKEEILLGTALKQLPCKHHYHEFCILPWLKIRNTCPVCRFELPTDDPDYEKSKSRRTGVAGTSREGSQFSNIIEIPPPEESEQANFLTLL